MANILGKRKRQSHTKSTAEIDDGSCSSDETDVQAAFKRAFEAKFKPLKNEKRQPVRSEPASSAVTAPESKDEPNWSGFSGSESDADPEDIAVIVQAATPAVEVVEHGRNYTRTTQFDRKEHDAFMV